MTWAINKSELDEVKALCLLRIVHFSEPLRNSDNESGETEVQGYTSLLRLWVLVEAGCRGYGTESFAQRCLATVDMAKHTYIDI